MLRRMMMAEAGGATPPGDWTPADLPDMPHVWCDESTEIYAVRNWRSRGAVAGIELHGDSQAVVDPSGMNGKRTVHGRFSVGSPTNPGASTALLCGASHPWVAIVCWPDAAQSEPVRRLFASYHLGTAFRFSLFSSIASATTITPYMSLMAQPDDASADVAAPAGAIAPYAIIGSADMVAGAGFISHNGSLTSSPLSFSDTELSTTPGSYSPYVGEAYLPIPAYSGQYERGKFAEVLVGDGPLIEADRHKLEGYLAHKWGIASALPAGHPYKDAAP